MEQFEKWFKKNKPYETYSCMNMADKAWKAALMWVLIAEWNTPDELTELISKELLNE